MALDFPASPSLNQVYTLGTKSWVWNGSGWEVQRPYGIYGVFNTNTLSSAAGAGGGSAVFNGTAYRFTLSHPPASAEQLIVSINGVIQKPNAGTSQPAEGFAVDGADILFSDAPATDTPFFIVTIGTTVNIGEPSDNSVTSAKLSDNSVTSAKIVDGTIVDADINASAAIAGSKINPDFGSQNLTTTGTSTAASFIPTSSTVPTNGVYLPGANSLGLSTDGTLRTTIDSSGRLLVGTSTARGNFYNGVNTTQFQIEGTTYQNSSQTLICNNVNSADPPILGFAKSAGSTVGSNTLVASGHKLGELIFQGNDGTEFVESVKITAEVDGTPGANDMPGRIVLSTTALGASSPTQRVRITNRGAFQTIADSGIDVIYAATPSAAGTAVAIMRGLRSATPGSPGSGTDVFYIFSNGTVQNATGTYTTISDAKLKENIVDANSQWDDLKNIKIRNWNFKEETGQETHRQLGPIAQELEEVCPGLVFEVPDKDQDGNELGTTTKGVMQSVLYMKAVKALQEAMERIETLEAKVAALEAAPQ